MLANTAPRQVRFLGLMLKTGWLRTALGQPIWSAGENDRRVRRSALVLRDGYRQFGAVGEVDPLADEKSFARTRQARVIPLVARQSISRLASATRHVRHVRNSIRLS